MYGVFRKLGIFGEDMMIMKMRSEKTIEADCRKMLEHFEEKVQETADEIGVSKTAVRKKIEENLEKYSIGEV